MPAPKGNQYAVAHGSGRPPKYDSIALAKSLDEWSKLETSYNLVGFCLKEEICDYTLHDLNDRCEVFSNSLKLARMRLSERRDAMLMANTLPAKMWERYVDCYDPFLYKHEEKKKDNEAKRKQEDSKQISSINFKVNYAPGNGDSIQILPEVISTESPPSTP